MSSYMPASEYDQGDDKYCVSARIGVHFPVAFTHNQHAGNRQVFYENENRISTLSSSWSIQGLGLNSNPSWNGAHYLKCSKTKCIGPKLFYAKCIRLACLLKLCEFNLIIIITIEVCLACCWLVDGSNFIVHLEKTLRLTGGIRHLHEYVFTVHPLSSFDLWYIDT